MDGLEDVPSNTTGGSGGQGASQVAPRTSKGGDILYIQAPAIPYEDNPDDYIQLDTFDEESTTTNTLSGPRIGLNAGNFNPSTDTLKPGNGGLNGFNRFAKSWNEYNDKPARWVPDFFNGLSIIGYSLTNTAWHLAQFAVNKTHWSDIDGSEISMKDKAVTGLGALSLFVPAAPKGIGVGLKAENFATSSSGMFRRVANQGAYSGLEVNMELKAVKQYAKEAGVGLKGIEISIIRDPQLVGKSVFGYAYPSGKKMLLYPDAFINPETLVRTLGHERTHLYQFKTLIRGRKFGVEEGKLLEKSAIEIEDSFVEYWKLNRGY